MVNNKIFNWGLIVMHKKVISWSVIKYKPYLETLKWKKLQMEAEFRQPINKCPVREQSCLQTEI